MRIGFIAVGSELLGTHRLDTNSLTLSKLLMRYGLELHRKSVVGDDRSQLNLEITRYLSDCDLVVMSGGLGPTSDDRTREGLADAVRRKLVRDPGLVEELQKRFESRGLSMPLANLAQADVIEGARGLANEWGSAPGQKVEEGGTHVFLLPGPPREFGPMLERHLQPWLEKREGEPRSRGLLKVACQPESLVEDRLRPFYEEFGDSGLTILASPGEIRLELEGGSSPDERDRLQTKMDRLRSLMGSSVFTDRDQSLEAVVGDLLTTTGQSVSTAESCTGGLLGYRMTSVPGASQWYWGSVVAYQNQVKREVLGVPEELISTDGAVSASVARAMAEGVRRFMKTDYGLAVTGIAGPSGGTEEKPVGRVHLALADGEGSPWALQVTLPGDRTMIRRLTSQIGLEIIRRTLLQKPWRGLLR